MGASRDRVFLGYYSSLIWEYHYPGIWESLPFDLGQIPGDLYGPHNHSSSN
jgi:hypothetical protein